MAAPDALGDILDRIANGEETEGDMQTLRQLLRAGNGQNVQLGKNIANIVDAQGDIQIGDRIYQGTDAEAIKAALRSVLQEARKANRPRNEKLLLTAVKQEVIARLKQSLHNAVLINLGKEQQPEQVKRPWDAEIKIGSKPTEPIPDTTSILEVFDQEEIQGRLLILGASGSGKTTTLLDLAKALIERAEQQPDYPIVLLFNLSSWKDDKQSMRDWLVAELKSKYGVQADSGKKWLDERKLLPMLDGLDELEATRQEPCVQAINKLLTGENPPLYLVVCSRSEEYANYETRLQHNGAICLQALTEDQIEDYLTKVKRAGLWHTISNDLVLLELVRAPLLLSITILAYQEVSSEQWQQLNSTEDRLQYLLDTYIRRMLTRHINSTLYKKRNAPSVRQTRLWLTYLAQQLQKESRTEFLIEKMQPTWLPTGSQRRNYNLGVRTILTLIAGLTAGLISGIGIGLSEGIINGIIFGIIFGIITGLFGGLSLWSVIGRSQEIKNVETLNLSLGNLISVFVFTLVFILSFFILQSLANHWFLIGFIFLLSKNLTGSDIETRTIPNQGIWKSAVNSCFMGLVGGIFSGIAYGLSSAQLNVGLGFGLGFGVISGLFGGGLTCVKHFTLRLILYRNGYIPWNYACFLNYCTDHLLLEQIGGRYRFIHKLLQEHFAAMHLSSCDLPDYVGESSQIQDRHREA